MYTRTKPGGGKINKDAYEAVWEQVNGRKLVYPAQRYAKPVFMEAEGFEWVPLDGGQGVDYKLLGVFSECRVRIAKFRLQPGSSMALDDNSIYFIETGEGDVDGTAYEKYGTVYLHENEAASLSATTETMLLQLGLPYFNHN